MNGSPTARPYADAVVSYAQAGWPCILPVPAADKFPPPVGYTGADGKDTDPLDLVRFAGSHPAHSVALRMPEGVLGIDVDQYVKKGVQKRGADTLAACVERWGPLPYTWTSTARGDGPSRIHFYRVPPQRYATKLTGPASGDVEVIQRHHRYAVVWPSPHAADESLNGAVYRWYGPDGVLSDRPPSPAELAELPPAWVAGLAEGATDQGPAAADPESGRTLLDQLAEDWRPECADLTRAREAARRELAAADAGSRHDTMTARVHHVVQLAAQGHTGVAYALGELRETWAKLTAGEDRAEELDRMLLTSARKAVTLVGAHQVTRDPCLWLSGFTLPAALSPGDPAYRAAGENAPEAILEPPRWTSLREVIGAGVFDPKADLDQTLAESVLARTYPALRHAYDAGSWLLRVPDRWELYGRLSPWAVAQVATLMPLGDPLADKGSDEQARAARRHRLMSNAGARAVAGKIDDLVSGGMHPAAVALAGLDAEPEILWAGGVPYDLRACAREASVSAWAAGMDPATPHLHSVQVVPAHIPTPLWDAFLAAVWPDEELRAWALRVLSITVTGYADRALPILLGETGRGKTQVVSLLMSVLGTYAHAANPKLLTAAANEHDAIKFALKGRRLSFIDEAPSEARAGQELLKMLTGGGELEARQMNQNPVTFRPTHTLVLTANDEPLLTDAAVRARARLIPCDGDPEEVRLARAAIGHLSGSAWRTEAPGVLAAMMGEAAAWLADPTSALVTAAPESVRYLAEHIGAEQDPVAVWLSEETKPHEAGTPSRELYQAFTASCLRNNLRRDLVPTETRWGRALTRFGYPSMHTVHGKRRALRIRPLGWSDSSAPNPDGFMVHNDGFMTGSNPNPSQEVIAGQPAFSPSPVTGMTGLTTSEALTHAPARTHEHRPESGGQPVIPSSSPVTKAKRERTPEQAQATAEKLAAKRAERIAEAIAAADGGYVGLPALVTPDGTGSTIARRIEPQDGMALLRTITDTGSALTVDVEHTGYPIGHAAYALRTIQLGNEHFAVVLDAQQAAQRDVAAYHLEHAAVLHAHSATADLVPLAVAGLVDYEEAWSRMRDTAIPAKLADPASTGNDASLKKLAPALLGDQAVSPESDDARAALFKAGKWLTKVEPTTTPERSGWAQVDPTCATMVRYAGSDVLDDAAVAHRIAWPAQDTLERELTAQRMTARVTYRGLPLDPVQVNTLRPIQQAALAEAGARLRELSGGAIENPGSDLQVAAAATALGAALPRTATGRPSVAKGALEQYARLDGALGEFVRARLAYQKAETALGLFLEPYRLLLERGDGRARPTVYTLGADTGRMSCVRPNLQQVPREGGYRACITADPGHLLISADFAGVELRVAAALSQDPALLAMLAEGVDLHWQAARQVFGPQATKADRYQAKRGVFGWLYGGKAPTLAGHMGVSQPTAQALVDTMSVMLPGVTEWARSTKLGVEAGRTQFRTYSGRIVHMPVKAPHAAPNYCIQGTARELLIDALMRWEQTPWGGCTLLPVHDELLAMVPEDEAAEATAALVECMTSELFGIPIAAEVAAPSFAWQDSV